MKCLGTLSLVVLLIGLIAIPAHAGICGVDSEPAATLLLPYFEVDLDDPSGGTTLFSINNAAAAPTAVHVVLWSDMGVPVVRFFLYLTGYDVQSVNLRDVIVRGRLPTTGSTSSPRGDLSDPNDPFSGCQDPASPPQLDANTIAHMRASFTGQPSPLFNGLCLGQDLGDGVARGFLTADVVVRCGSELPNEAAYFGPQGMAGNDNVLWGDYFLVDGSENFAQGEKLVALQADAESFGDGDATFYGRFVGFDGSDGREPLPSAWGARFLQGGGFDGSTRLVAWAGFPAAQDPFPCAGRPAWYPLEIDSGRMGWFDEQENVDLPGCFIVDPPPLFCLTQFPAVANGLDLQDISFAAPWNAGWAYTLFPGEGGAQGQAWMGSLIEAEGQFSLGFTGTPLDTGCAPLEDTPWNLR